MFCEPIGDVVTRFRISWTPMLMGVLASHSAKACIAYLYFALPKYPKS